MKCKNVLTFWRFIAKRLQTLFFPSTYPVNSVVSVVVRMYKIHALEEVVFPLGSFCYAK